ncbi:TAXI family TRAP transporter solute-binding subunit [Bradyrhizobium sp. G127]|jgi:TRAP transporter TAXI family solute receptor|uniref:TAXI family TRAP transporter solute-binding subunit n=1 Tax=Bradyrhizobium sp. G127 TaxID=2904800 RepID=UPI001F3BF060|nr:TAXI family TRAP transporter solute-binding subunit [Bradyrhizobium sp. G127]MCF2521375.1 ABC transporter substrate-binding protein [Bradyrhizobium sp. G127]
MSFSDMFSRSTAGDGLRPASTPRPHKMKAMMMIVAAVLATVAAVGGTIYYLNRPVHLRIAVGPPYSDDVKVIQSIAQTLSRDRKYVRLRPIVTEGTSASAASFNAGTTDLAVIRGDTELPKDAMAVASIRKNFAVLWAIGTGKKKGAITKIEQLAGKRVGVIGRTQANVNLLKVILTQSGVKPESVQVVQFTTTGFADAVKNEKLDAFLAVGPLNSKITADAIAATTRDGKTATFLTLDTADAIAQKYPVYESGEIPAGTFGAKPVRPEDKIDTISFAHHIVARKSLSEVTVGALTRELFSIRQAVQNEFPQTAKLETPDTDKDAAIPAHPGAAAYVDGEEKSFLDKYSDYIWGSLMALSALGSAGAWFASYLRKDERVTNSGLRERLLEMLTAARKSTSIDELDGMQAEADEIMRDTLHCFEDGAIEEGSLTAFSIALEQFHNAVADRKTFLLDMGSKVVPPVRSHVA